MAAGRGKVSFTMRRFRATREFHFAIGPRAGWAIRLAAIPIVIAAFVLGVFSIAILMGGVVLVALTFGIRRWGLRFRTRGTANAGDVPQVAPTRLLPPPEIAPRVNGPDS